MATFVGGLMVSDWLQYIMTQLWLVPADEPSFQETLATPVDLSDRAQKPDDFPDRTRVWGVRTDPEQGDWERNRRNLERMETDDPMLIYRNETSQYCATARVGTSWHTTSIRDEFWNGGPAIDVFSVAAYEEADIERETVNEILGYEDEFWPQGLWRVSDDRPTERVVRAFDI